MQTEDLSIAVEDSGGDGHPLLLLHGFTRTLLDWALVSPQLRENYRVLTMDFRNHGRTGAGPWFWPAVLNDIECVLENCDAMNAFIVGHSLGGIVAALYANSHPEIKAIVNLDGFGKGQPTHYIGLDPETVRMRQTELNRIGAVHAGKRVPASSLETIIKRSFSLADKLGVPRPLFELSFRRRLREDQTGAYVWRPNASQFLEFQEQLDQLDVFALLGSLSCRTLIVRATKPDPREAQIEWLPNLIRAYSEGIFQQLEALPKSFNREIAYLDATHALLLEQPAAVSGLILRFLSNDR